MVVDRSAIPVPRSEFQLEELDGETLLYRHSLKKLIYLNESAASVWKLCDGRRTVEDIGALLAQAYPEIAGSVLTDVDGAIESLVLEGALHIGDQSEEIGPDDSNPVAS